MAQLISKQKQIKPTGVRRVQERTEVARSKLINAGVPLFAEKGFDAVSIRDIEIASGVKRGMLIYHFDNKKNFGKLSLISHFNKLNIKEIYASI